VPTAPADLTGSTAPADSSLRPERRGDEVLQYRTCVRYGQGMPGPGAYAELHCHTNFSFLDGASHPEELAAEAARLGLAALAVTDHDGLYGVVRFALAARPAGLPTVFGAELTLGITRPANGEPDPEGEHLLILAEGPVGYARLARAISQVQLAGEKGAPRTTLAALADAARAPVHVHPRASRANDSWFVLTGCRKGTVPSALVRDGPAAARRALDGLVAGFGRDRVLVELWDHGDPLDRHRNDALARVAMSAGVEVVATNNVHYATPAQRPLATALAAIRARRSLDEIDGWLPASPLAHLRSAGEQARRFARWPGAVERTVDVAGACAFDLRVAAPDLPDHDVPPGHTEMTWLRDLTTRGAALRYPSTHKCHEQAMRQIAHELDVIEQLNFPGYFLVLVEIVEFCRVHDIYCQGRGSAANSAVCYALGVTKADAVELGLLFERFLSLERDGPPDIDLDIEHQRREEVIHQSARTMGTIAIITARSASIASMVRRRSHRDAARAASGPPIAAGISRSVSTPPTATGEPVSASASAMNATVPIQSPSEETPWPARRVRNPLRRTSAVTLTVPATRGRGRRPAGRRTRGRAPARRGLSADGCRARASPASGARSPHRRARPSRLPRVRAPG
jgi:error-prone DNA polymerase